MKAGKRSIPRAAGHWLVLLVLVLALVGPGAGAAGPEVVHPQYEEITGNITWDSDRALNTDVVVTNGAILSIQDITVTANWQDEGVPYAKGLSPKIEIIVEEGGMLLVDAGASLTATIPGEWYGVVFLPGSLGNITGAEIGNGTVGITLYDAAPTIQQNTIHNMWGDNGPFPGENGGVGAGIVISGTSAAQIISNTITSIYGGSGVYGWDGWLGVDGTKGGNGGPAYGILAEAGASPTLQGNTITWVGGGNGGFGGWGGDGPGGVTAGEQGEDGGSGGEGGRGGDAWGIYLGAVDPGWTIRDNLVGWVSGGSGGDGGQGGRSGPGADGDPITLNGGWAGEAGDGGDGGYGGHAFGIEAEMATSFIPLLARTGLASHAEAAVQGNAITGPIRGGAGGAGSRGGDGSTGGHGATPTSGLPRSAGGAGGWGGPGGAGGDGGKGGLGSGIEADFDLVENEVRAIVVGGAGGAGGYGGDGGQGGPGGDGEDHPLEAGSGGQGGRGGNGGEAGHAGVTEDADGIIATDGHSLIRNRVTTVWANAPSGPGGQGGSGGPGGHGGDGGDGGLGGDGGPGGPGGTGGSGGRGSYGGNAAGLGLFGPATAENNQTSSVFGGMGTAGGDGGVGGNGGNGGNGGLGGGGNPDGVGGTGGPGGDGGDGENGGGGGDATGLDGGGGSLTLIHNTIAAVGAGLPGSGGSGGPGGDGGVDAQGGNASSGLQGTSGATGFSGYGMGIALGGWLLGQAEARLDATQTYTIVNNIVVDVALGLQQAPAATVPSVGISGQSSGAITTLDYNDVYGWDEGYEYVTAGPHDISEDPLFVDVNRADLHLSPGSPCIDAGTSSFPGLTLPTLDIDGDRRPQGKSHDMGADEYAGRVFLPLVLHNTR
jgi:hypothetical protein